MPQRIILHVDMDAFFAAVEQRDRPELRGRPVIVGGRPEQRGVVSAASYEAREFGVHSAMPAATARRLCPHGVFLPVDGKKYRRVSEQVMAILARHADVLERLSIDEAFLDVSDRVSDFREAEGLARRIKGEIRRELNLTASVGVGPNKFLAKLGSDLDKPDGLVVIRPDEVEKALAPLPVGRLWGVGPKTEKRLQDLGLRTIGDIARTPPERLRALLGAWGEVIHELARGVDERPVEPHRASKSVSAEETFAADLYAPVEMRRALARLSKRVARRLRAQGLRARTIAIKVRFDDFRTITRQTRLPRPSDQEAAVRGAAWRLLDGVERGERGIRLLGVRASNFAQGPRQVSLFDPRAQKRAQLEKSLAYLRKRFGPDAVRWARDYERRG